MSSVYEPRVENYQPDAIDFDVAAKLARINLRISGVPQPGAIGTVDSADSVESLTDNVGALEDFELVDSPALQNNEVPIEQAETFEFLSTNPRKSAVRNKVAALSLALSMGVVGFAAGSANDSDADVTAMSVGSISNAKEDNPSQEIREVKNAIAANEAENAAIIRSKNIEAYSKITAVRNEANEDTGMIFQATIKLLDELKATKAEVQEARRDEANAQDELKVLAGLRVADREKAQSELVKALVLSEKRLNAFWLTKLNDYKAFAARDKKAAQTTAYLAGVRAGRNAPR